MLYQIKKVNKKTMYCMGYLSHDGQSWVSPHADPKLRAKLTEAVADAYIATYGNDIRYYYFKVYNIQ